MIKSNGKWLGIAALAAAILVGCGEVEHYGEKAKQAISGQDKFQGWKSAAKSGCRAQKHFVILEWRVHSRNHSDPEECFAAWQGGDSFAES